ncbi:hypothetical protein FSP39_007325 [Pinctada imbricata]|uniref:Chitin-binding type-4 domain-containing protein n=1 Tax=Pinctada imbricata TaxID=66713 RepID=A0AA88Y9K6_PINIB|nr:hypothetical protein FSP39_007325 [Pinctada imbricata]
MKELYVLVVFCLLDGVTGHGRLLEPPSRSSLWRFGLSGLYNYNDNSLYCGGFMNQYFKNNGKCGICGDPYQGPRDNEAGGKYATGFIARHYTAGQVMNVVVEVTVNHYGYFEFKICPNNDVKKAATKECLDKHLLSLTNGTTRYYVTQNIVGKYHITLQLPKDLTCTQCVFQWRWHGGNNWGRDPLTGRSCLGCGPQEEFYGCADVAISDGSGQSQVSGGSANSQVSGGSNNGHASGGSAIQRPVWNPFVQSWGRVTRPPTTRTTRPPVQTQPPVQVQNPQYIFRPGVDLSKQTTTTTEAPQKTGGSKCRGINNWNGIAYFDRWCTIQCGRGNCPSNACSCS